MNSATGAISFTTNGESRYFRLSTNAQVRYQDAAGETLLDAMAGLQKNPGDLRRVRRMIWAALSHEGLTEDAAGDLMDELGQVEAARLLGEAIQAAFPQAADGGEGNGRGAKKAPKSETP